MGQERYKAEDVIKFGTDFLIKVGFTENQASAAAKILVEADLRGDFAHGITGGNGLDSILMKVNDDEEKLGFKRIEIADYAIDDSRYDIGIAVDANGTLGHYVALDIMPLIIETAKKHGAAKAFIRNSTHFGDCGIYSEMLAAHDLFSRVTCTSPQWSKPFVELQDKDSEDSPRNRSRYSGVKKRFGTNPIACSIPYDGGIVTIDMATTQRAASPALEVVRHNSRILNITREADGFLYIGRGERRRKLSEVHLSLARNETRDRFLKALKALGYDDTVTIRSVEKGLLKGPEGEDINYPLAFDHTFLNDFWIAPLGGTYFGYKGFGLSMLTELENVMGGGIPGLIRMHDDKGNPTIPERVSQTIEAYPIDLVMPLDEAKAKIRESIDTTLKCSNDLVYLPGQKEQEKRRFRLEKGVPYRPDQINYLTEVGDQVGVPFKVDPQS